MRRVTLTLLVVTLLVGAAIEQTYRIYLFGWAAFSYARLNSLHDLGHSGLIQASENQELVYELKPDLDTYFKLARFRTNSVGLCDEEYSPHRPPNTRRIALVGSSFSMASGVTLEGSWHYLVERRLDAAEPSRRHEIINFAVGGYNARQMVAVLERKVFAYQPELIVFELTANTPYMTIPDDFYKLQYTVRPAASLFWQSFALKSIYRRFRSRNPGSPQYSDEILAELETMLQRARDVSHSHGIPLCFLILNIDPSSERNASILGQRASRYSQCVIQTAAAFRNMALQELVQTDQHPNSKAHAIFADVIAPRIAVELGMPFP